ncbi:MAG: hypothetical protein HYU81_01635 [Candidatus Brennerbacteria bacterium]|nr:hypothetical protein [Candidatus Brennerbacteria bacterium]
MKHKGAIMGLIMMMVIFAIAPFALAGGHEPQGNVIELPNPLGATSTPAELLDKILTFLIQIGGVIASIMVIVGAFQMLFAAGDPEKFIIGRRTVIYVAVGYGILLMAKGVTLIIKDFLTIKP